jgi:peptide deformylase
MAKLPIVLAPDPVLKAKAKPIASVDDSVRRLMDDMLETMYAAPGIGLAANQIGVLKRVIVLDVAREGDAPTPVGMELSVHNEGCLSLPDHYADITRPKEVRVRYLDRDGKKQEIEADGLFATCIQHEIDHLDGVLFVDHLSALKRNMILKKLVKLKKQMAEDAE